VTREYDRDDPDEHEYHPFRGDHGVDWGRSEASVLMSERDTNALPWAKPYL
jgi:hypothetical protein